MNTFVSPHKGHVWLVEVHVCFLVSGAVGLRGLKVTFFNSLQQIHCFMSHFIHLLANACAVFACRNSHNALNGLNLFRWSYHFQCSNVLFHNWRWTAICHSGSLASACLCCKWMFCGICAAYHKVMPLLCWLLPWFLLILVLKRSILCVCMEPQHHWALEENLRVHVSLPWGTRLL